MRWRICTGWLFLSLALAAFVLAERVPARRRVFLLAMYVAIGLGVLTKGPVAAVLPAIVCACWLANCDTGTIMDIAGRGTIYRW